MKKRKKEKKAKKKWERFLKASAYRSDIEYRKESEYTAIHGVHVSCGECWYCAAADRREKEFVSVRYFLENAKPGDVVPHKFFEGSYDDVCREISRWGVDVESGNAERHFNCFEYNAFFDSQVVV